MKRLSSISVEPLKQRPMFVIAYLHRAGGLPKSGKVWFGDCKTILKRQVSPESLMKPIVVGDSFMLPKVKLTRQLKNFTTAIHKSQATIGLSRADLPRGNAYVTKDEVALAIEDYNHCN